MKVHMGDGKSAIESESSDDDEEEVQIIQGKKPQNFELLITDLNINEI